MKTILILAVLLTLPACALLKPAPSPDALYVLTAEPQPDAGGTPLPLSIKVARPDVAPGLGTARIALQQTPATLTYYTGVAWAAPLPEVAQEFFTDAVERSHAFRTAGSDEEAMRTNVTLLIALHECQVDASGASPVIHLRLTATLVDSESRKALASVPVEEKVTAEENHMPVLVAAFNQAFNAAAREVMPAVIEAAQSYRPEE